DWRSTMQQIISYQHNTIAQTQLHSHATPPQRVPSIATSTPGPPAHTRGKNTPAGVIGDFWLKEKPGDTDKVTLEFLAGDRVLRTFTSAKEEKKEGEEDDLALDDADKDKEKPLELHAGLNRFEWDMRILKATLVPKAVFNE